MNRGDATSRRALTLIEVVAATVLLTMLAATGVTLIRAARASIEAPVDDQVIFDLGVFADAFMEDPEWFGVTTPLYEFREGDMTLTWRDREDVPLRPARLDAVRVRAARPSDAGQDHLWLVFQPLQGVERGTDPSGDKGWSVSRLVPVPPRQEPRP